MSGIVNGHENWDRSRNHRYETMLRKINKSNTSSQESLYESRMQSSTFKTNNGVLDTQSFYPMQCNSIRNNFHMDEQMKFPSVSQTSGSIVSGRTNRSNLGSSIRYKNNTSQSVKQPHVQGSNTNRNEFCTDQILNAPSTTTSESNYAASEATLLKPSFPTRHLNDTTSFKGRLQQPYLQGLNPNRNDFFGPEISNAPSATASESNYAASDATIFKKPFPLRHLDGYAIFKGRMDVMLGSCREDKPYLRFLSRLIESAMKVYFKQISKPVIYTSVLEMINQTFIEAYGSEFLKGVCSSAPSSVRSESMISVNQGLHETFSGTQVQGNTLIRRPAENCQSQMPMYDRNMNTSSLSLININDSGAAHRRDELVLPPIQHSKTQSRAINVMAVPKSKPNASLITRGRPKKMDSSVLQPTNKEMLQETVTPSPAVGVGVKGITRTGRVVRSPQPFWKGNDSTREPIKASKEKAECSRQTTIIEKTNKKKVDLNESMTLRNKKVVEKKKTPPIKNSSHKNTPLAEIDLNESMTLRNKKVVEKKKTPPIKNSSHKNTPLAEVSKSNETLNTKTKAVQGNKSGGNKEDKENLIPLKGRPRNKQNKKGPAKEDSSTLEKSTKTSKIEKNVRKEPAEKKVRKRKNEEKQESLLDVSIFKKKKIGEMLNHSSEHDLDLDDDDLFGIDQYKKSTISACHVLSPKSCMMSIKKDAASSFSKETPPCKALGQFMSQSGISAASSSKEVPATKPDKVVKRVEKVLKRKVSRPAPKQTAKKPATNRVPKISPLTTANLIHLELGKCSENSSDESDFENSEDDDSDLQ